jgi:hypothetical protein
MSDIIKPCRHLNGSGRKNLEDQYRAAIEALGLATDAVAASAPHGRDYYPLDDGETHGPSYKRAREEHAARLGKLAIVEGELRELWEEVFSWRD